LKSKELAESERGRRLCYDAVAVRILVDYRPALRHPSGVGEYMHRMVTALSARLARPHSLTVFSSSFKDRLRQPAAAVSTVDARVPVRVLNFAWHRLEWPPVEWLAGRFDVVQSAHPLLIPSRQGVRAVLIADLDFLDHPERTHAEIRRDYPSLAPIHAKRADLIVTISDYTAARIATRFDVPPDRVVVCHPGAPDWSPRASPGAVAGPILFIGTIEPRKNLGVLFRAYARLVGRSADAPPLVIAGRRGAAAEAILAELGRLPGIAGRVHLAGYVSDATRHALYAEASMLLLPSLDEGFGMTALEAMTAGVPVVASRRGALPEVIGSAGTLVEPDDEEGFATAMEGLLSDPARREAHAAAGVVRARAFDWSASAARLLDAYATAVERRSRGAA
jgi:glycosyltransferase involved in cell wall biosynthesis